MIVANLPRTSATAHAMFGERVEWGPTEYLLADLIDVVQIGNWQRQGKKGAPKPKPVPRPGATQTRKFGKDPIPLTQFDDWWESGGG